MADLISNLAGWATEVVHSFGYLGVAILMAMSCLFLPIPSELVLPLAGFLVGQGRLSFSLVILAATGGSLASALAVYAAGRRFGEERLRRVVKRFGRFVFVDESDLEKARGKFERHNGAAVSISWLFPGVSNLISVPAGVGRMPLWRFVACTALGSTVWNATFVGLGWALGSRWELVERYAPIAKYAVLAAVVLIILRLLLKRREASG